MELDSSTSDGTDERVHDDDVALLDALNGGGNDALRQLWARYGDVIYWAATGLTGDTTVATDAVVAAFVELQNTPRDARDEPLPQHLVAAVRRHCSHSGTRPSPNASSDSGVEEPCRTAIRSLTDQQLTVLSLVMSQRFRAREAARLFDLPLSTVCALLGDVLTMLAVQPRADEPHADSR